MVDTAKECLLYLQQTPSPLLDPQAITPFKRLLGTLDTSLAIFNDKHDSTCGSQEELIQGIATIFQMDDEIVDEVYRVSSTLYVTAIHLIVARTVLRNPNLYGSKVLCVDGKDKTFQRDRNVQAMFDYLSDCITPAPIDTSENDFDRLTNFETLMNLTPNNDRDDIADDTVIAGPSRPRNTPSTSRDTSTEQTGTSRWKPSPLFTYSTQKKSPRDPLSQESHMEDYKTALQIIEKMKKAATKKRRSEMKRRHNVIDESSDSSDEELDSPVAMTRKKSSRFTLRLEDEDEEEPVPSSVKKSLFVPLKKCSPSLPSSQASTSLQKVQKAKMAKNVETDSDSSDSTDDSEVEQNVSNVSVSKHTSPLPSPACLQTPPKKGRTTKASNVTTLTTMQKSPVNVTAKKTPLNSSSIALTSTVAPSFKTKCAIISKNQGIDSDSDSSDTSSDDVSTVKKSPGKTMNAASSSSKEIAKAAVNTKQKKENTNTPPTVPRSPFKEPKQSKPDPDKNQHTSSQEESTGEKNKKKSKKEKKEKTEELPAETASTPKKSKKSKKQ